MPLPLFDSNCEVPTDVCCTSLFDAATSLLDWVLADLNACVPDGDCYPALRGYVTVGDFPEDPLCDTVIVTATGLQAISPGVSGKTLGIAQHRASFLVQLSESGFPIIGAYDDQIYAPDPSVVNEIARHSYSHGERLYRSVINAFNPLDGIVGCGFVSLDDFRPINPSGGCVGWRVGVTVQVALSPISSVVGS